MTSFYGSIPLSLEQAATHWSMINSPFLKFVTSIDAFDSTRLGLGSGSNSNSISENTRFKSRLSNENQQLSLHIGKQSAETKLVKGRVNRVPSWIKLQARDLLGSIESKIDKMGPVRIARPWSAPLVITTGKSVDRGHSNLHRAIPHETQSSASFIRSRASAANTPVKIVEKLHKPLIPRPNYKKMIASTGLDIFQDKFHPFHHGHPDK
jgi:hypothetical protein